MNELYRRLLEKGTQPLSINSSLCKVISFVYSDIRSFNDDNNPLKGKVTQDEVKSLIHKSNLIQELLPYKDSESFIENYMNYCWF
jgi:hypothetical protein